VGLDLFGGLRLAAENASPLQFHHPDALHLGQVEDIRSAAHENEVCPQILPQLLLADKLQFPLIHIAMVPVKADHFGHIGRQLDARSGHAAGRGPHLTGLPIQALISDGGDKTRLALFDGLGQVVNGAYRHRK